MTAIRIELFTGTGQPAVGSISFVATSRIPFEDGILLPTPVEVHLYGGEVHVEVPPSPEEANPEWAWRITENIIGGTGTTRLVTVPDSVEEISYRDDLIDLEEPDVTGPGGYTYIKTINGLEPDANGNIVVAGTGAVDTVNGQIGNVTLDHEDVGAAAEDHTHTVADIDATGTADATTYLRGDGSWATPEGSGGGGAVDSVNGQTGEVVLDHTDVGAAAATHNHAISDITNLTTQLAGKQNVGDAPAAHTHDVDDLNATGTADDTTFLRGDGSWAVPAGGGGTSDHGSLTGLGDDDHTQYHTDARGDARYYTKTQVDTALGGKSNTGHGHAISEITDLNNALDGKSNIGHSHDVDDLNATGTPSETTYLRGDGTWATPDTGGGSSGIDFVDDTAALSASNNYGLYVTILDDGTPTANWPDRMRFIFDPQSGSNVQTSWFNEYGEFRGTPAKSNTVGMRIFVGTGPSDYTARNVTVPVFEVSSDRTDRVTKFAVYGDGDTYIDKDLEVAGTVTADNVAQRVETHPTGTAVPPGTPDGTLWVEYTP